MGDEGALEINLGHLPAEAVAEIVKGRLRASRFSPTLASFVQARTGGNPFYCEEFVAALRDAGAISVERGVGALNADTVNSAKMALPASLESAIVARVRCASSGGAAFIEGSSAVGGPVKAELLLKRLPRGSSAFRHSCDLERLVGRELLRALKIAPGRSMNFDMPSARRFPPTCCRSRSGGFSTPQSDRAGTGPRRTPRTALWPLARHWERAGGNGAGN